MADRTSAALFGELFQDLADQETPDLKLVKKLWQKTRNYDFDYYQMNCDAALKKLGLCKDTGGGNGRVFYANADATGWEED